MGEIVSLKKKNKPYKKTRKCKSYHVPDHIVVWQRNGSSQYQHYFFTSYVFLIAIYLQSDFASA